MGAVSSDDLLKETVIFDFYERNAKRYKKALDVGANIGIHSILMARCGWEVKAFEPDPQHFTQLKRNLKRSSVTVEAFEAAVSTQDGEAQFVRVLGNTTANHIYGSRSFYGPMEIITVKTVDCRPLFDWADFAKIDCEGHEAEILLHLQKIPDILVEIGNPENARRIFEHFTGLLIPIWSQKTNWQQVRTLDQMPTHYKEGSLFVGPTSPFIGPS